MKKDLIIVGSGGHGRGVLEIAEAMNDEKPVWNILGFLDENPDKHGSTVCGYPVLGGCEFIQRHQAMVSVCIGSASTRRRVVHDLVSSGNVEFATLIHPMTILSKRSEVADGVVVFGGACIDTNTHIGRHVLIGRNATVGHDITIGDYANIFPSATLSGDTYVGEGSEIGSNATVIPGIHIKQWSTVGASAVVTSNLEANVTAVGMPAKVVKRREEGWHLL